MRWCTFRDDNVFWGSYLCWETDFAMLAKTNTKTLLCTPAAIGFAVVLLLFSSWSVTGQAQVTSGEYSGAVARGTNSPGAPFSASVVTEYDRPLPNGDRIHREMHGKIIRDSAGRTRRETELGMWLPASEKRGHILIVDPVAQLIINIDPQNKTASVVHSQPMPGTGGASSGNANLLPPTPSSGPVPPTAATTAGSKNTPELSIKEGGRSLITDDHTLGTKMMEGVEVVGMRINRTIEAGSMGNAEPVVSYTEAWFSPELGTMMETRTNDPQSGTSSMRLVNLERNEPDPALFQIPAGYTIQDERPQ